MVVPAEIRQRAIALLEQLPGESLVKAVEFLEALSHEALQVSKPSNFSVDEAALLQIIQRRPSSEEQDRLTYLRQQNEMGVITDTEHQELLMYVERVEQQDAERAEALIKLAQLRQVNLQVLINEFLPIHNKPNELFFNLLHQLAEKQTNHLDEGISSSLLTSLV